MIVVTRDSQDSREHRESRVLRVRKERRATADLRDLLGRSVHPVTEARMVTPVLRVK